MKIVINTIASMSLLLQLFFCMFNAMSLKKPECIMDSLYNYFVLAVVLCSLLSVVIFLFLYNCNGKSFKKWHYIILFIIVLLGAFAHLWQLIGQHEPLPSAILLLLDIYIIRKILLSLR